MHLPEHFLLLQFDLRSPACRLCMLWCLLLLLWCLLLLLWCLLLLLWEWRRVWSLQIRIVNLSFPILVDLSCVDASRRQSGSSSSCARDVALDALGGPAGRLV